MGRTQPEPRSAEPWGCDMRVWAKVPSARAKHLPREFSLRRLRGCVYQRDGHGCHKVGFDVPEDMSTQEAILLLSSLTPPSTEIYAE